MFHILKWVPPEYHHYLLEEYKMYNWQYYEDFYSTFYDDVIDYIQRYPEELDYNFVLKRVRKDKIEKLMRVTDESPKNNENEK